MCYASLVRVNKGEKMTGIHQVMYEAVFGTDALRAPLTFGEIEDYRVSDTAMQLAVETAAQNRARCVARMKVCHKTGFELDDIKARLSAQMKEMR